MREAERHPSQIEILPLIYRTYLNTKAPTLRSRPLRVVGMPVLRANFCFIAVIPSALFKEKESPGIFIMF